MTNFDVEQNPQAAENMRWYVIHAYSGMEKSVKKGLEEELKITHCKSIWQNSSTFRGGN
jgi:hypothetical protein